MQPKRVQVIYHASRREIFNGGVGGWTALASQHLGARLLRLIRTEIRELSIRDEGAQLKGSTALFLGPRITRGIKKIIHMETKGWLGGARPSRRPHRRRRRYCRPARHEVTCGGLREGDENYRMSKELHN